MLTQVKRNERYVRGSVEIQLTGTENGKTRRLSLAELSADKNNLKFKFRYFQEFSGQLLIPEGFLPERVTIRVVPSGKGKPPGVEETREWPVNEAG